MCVATSTISAWSPIVESNGCLIITTDLCCHYTNRASTVNHSNLLCLCQVDSRIHPVPPTIATVVHFHPFQSVVQRRTGAGTCYCRATQYPHSCIAMGAWLVLV